MKKSFSLIIMLAILLLSSCKNKNNPNSYSDEIEDAVRFQLAVANSMSDFESFDDFKEILNWMLEFSEDTKIRRESFRDILVKRSENDNAAKNILDLYDNLDIVLSELQATESEKIWTFTELNSGVGFTFELIPTQDGEMYYQCSADADDLQTLISKSVLKNVFDGLDLDF
ncbi:MAG: hypothetical protein IKU78_00870 [Paludibacteraceae bacterium]|nr:hypothetical protein [Paludibacteraceae bacterium]